MSVPRITNCPNCGAPIETDKCPFCGTRLINIADLNVGDAIWFIFNDVDHNVQRGIRLGIDHISITEETSDCAYYANNEPMFFGPTNYTIELSGHLAKNKKGIFGMVVDNPELDIHKVI